MKYELADIYRALSTGALSQQEALARIRALKLTAEASSTDISHAPAETLLAETVWESASATTGTAPVQHRVLLCGLSGVDAPQVQAALTGSRCALVEIAASATPAEAYATLALAYVDTIRVLLREKPQGRAVVQLAAADRDGAQLLAGLAGLIETAALENPDIAGQVLLLPADIHSDALIAHLRADAADPDARVLRYTHGARQVRRWRFADESAAASSDALCHFREHGVYLITGGLGGLGLLVAKEILTTAMHAKIVLCGRAEPSAEARAALAAFAAPGRVEYRQADIGDDAQTDALITGILADHGALHGVIHSAGLVRDDFILKKSAAHFADVLRPKVAGSEHLDRATAALPLDMFLLFSSIASWTGNVGQADYAAANGFMDQFAGWRNARVAAGERHGLSLAIAWPHWRDGGMNIDATSLSLLEKRTGLRSIDTADGMRALHRSLALGRSHVMAMHGVPAEMRRALTPERVASAAESIAPASTAPRTATPVAPQTDLIGKTRELLRSEFSAVLKIPAQKIDVKAPLEQYGIDSILAMNLTSQLEASFGALPKTLFFEYLNIDELAAYFVRAHAPTLRGMFAVSAPQQPASSTATGKPVSASAMPSLPASRRRNRFLAVTGDTAAPATLAHEPIAIVGLSGRYPESPDLDAFWRNLRDGRDCIVEVPASRWDWKAWYSEDRSVEGAHFSKWGGFIEGADEFDPRFFNIAPREARSIDPQERLFLQHAWMAIEDAGYTRAALQMSDAKGLPGQVGVYAGVMYGEYNLSGSLASIANRVSYFLNLHGPSLTLDTMCSSSLTALHLACQDLRLGRTALALAGGVNISIHPNKYTMLSGGQFISGDGHCQSFGEGGDGYIPGEGVGVAVLKRLSEAQRDGNHVYAVIRGSALNHGGKTNGYTVPNPQAQAEVIRRALGEAGIDPSHVSYIEAHGTGTKLGDPIEIAALTRAFHESSVVQGDDTGYCLIGSAKSNIGHCESAAGIAGVTKVLLQMRHASIVPSLHSKVLNPHIDFAATPFVVAQSLRAWERPIRNGRALSRIAGVSSFGAGGANAHVVLEEYVAAERPPTRSNALRLVPLSARNAEQLEARARDLFAFLDCEGDAVDTRDLAHTLQIGREAMDQRVCFVVDGLSALRTALHSFLADSSQVGDRIHTGNAKQQRDALTAHADDPAFQTQLERFIAERALLPLAALWAEGVEIDWRSLSDDIAPRLMSLPTYPFARERYWIAPATVNAPSAVKPTQLHPLVHSNVSDLEEHRYLARFDVRQAPLVDGTLPSLLALEALRAAFALAVPARTIANAKTGAKTGALILREIAWGTPMTAHDGADLALGIAVLSRSVEAIDLELYHADGADEAVFAQAHVLLVDDVSNPAGDTRDFLKLRTKLRAQALPQNEHVAALFAGEEALLAELRLPANEAMWLSPALAAALSALCERFEGAGFAPLSLRSLRANTACPAQAFAHLHRDADGALDITICDAQGRVCLALNGLISADAAHVDVIGAEAVVVPSTVVVPTVAMPAVIESTAAEPVLIKPMSSPREIPLGAPGPSSASNAPMFGPLPPKPSNIALRPAAEVPLAPVLLKTKIVLIPLTATSVTASETTTSTSMTRGVRLFDLGDGLFSLALETGSLDSAIDALLRALAHVRSAAQAHRAKALILDARDAGFWRGDRAVFNAAVAQGLYAALAQLPIPTIAAVPGDADGAGLLLAATCDFLVLADDARLRFADADTGWLPSEAEAAFLRERFGLSAEPLLTGGDAHDAQALGLRCRFVPTVDVSVEAQRIAADIGHAASLALGLLKPHLARRLAPLAAALAPTQALATDVLQSEMAAAERTLLITLGDGRDKCDAQSLLADLKTMIAHAAASDDIACVVITSALEGFLPELGEADVEGLIIEIDALLNTCPVPVIAALGTQADGAAWRFALACETAVYARDGLYAASALWVAPALARSTAALCALRLDSDLGRELQLTLGAYTGAELAARVPALRVAKSDDPLIDAMRLAAFWGRWSRASIIKYIAAERSRVAVAIAALLDHVADSDTDIDAGTVDVDVVVSLRTEVVTLSLHNDGVALIEMHDRAARNMFSPALVEGLKQAFAHAVAAPDCRAVVITGYDNYFATGGTLETLLAIQDGQAQFTDEKVFQLPMDCPLPTIAAIQGHSIGGGWSFGMFADAILLGEESRYLSPYMGYGFTPGAGSTLMFPTRIGYDLARETLLGAQEISGYSLKQRAVPIPVLPRRDVLPAALTLAHRIARQPRARLIALKRLWTQALRDAREDVYTCEVAMHAETFVDNADTLRTIQGKFRLQPAEAQLPPSVQNDEVIATPEMNVPASATVAVTWSSAAIIDSIRTMLAQELFLKPEEIDDDTPFIDLGLDSITGVTWVRRINAEYGIQIEATKVYSHPTLQALGRLVIDAARAGHAPAAATALPVPLVPAPTLPPATRSAAYIAKAPAIEDGARLRGVIAQIRTLLAAELHLQADEIEDGTPFIDMGLDSITGVTWVRRINTQFGIVIEATKVYSHPTLNEIGRLVLREAEQAGTLPPAIPPQPQATPQMTLTAVEAHGQMAATSHVRAALTSWRRRGQGIAAPLAIGQDSVSSSATGFSATASIAVIGIAGQFPQARDINAYWANLAAGRNCVDEVADERWSVDEYFRPGAPTAGKTNSKWLGTLDDYDRFDPLFFSISPTEAEMMDPQQRLFLEACWHAIENAGYAPQSLSASQCGVFVGCGPSDYHQASQTLRLSAQGFTGAATSILAARISYVLNLRGPCLSIDTACSSSLVAIAGACDSLNAGTSDLAIAGGVYVMGGPSMHVMTAQAGMLSTDGRCYTFDARANGFVPGEAVGAILLKRLSDAERDGDRIQAVIEGWGINQDGKTNGITAPNEDAQMRLLQSVYRRFDIDPASIQLIEAHGTGTKLGDPIEIAGLKAAFAPFTTQAGFCALGSVKSNIGHCLTAAGAASVIKLVLALRERQLPPTIHYAQRNEHIRLDDSPFYVNDTLQPWQPAAGVRRRAAVSSFGFSGTNAHIVLAEHRQTAAPAEPAVLSQNGRLIVPLSARSESQLRQQAERLCTYLRVRRAAGDNLRLVDVAYTLQVGRDEMGERLCVLVDSVDTLTDALEAFLADRTDAAVNFSGQVKRDRESLKLLQDEDMRATVIGKWLLDRRFDKLADLWAKGLALDWAAFYSGLVRPQRIALPGYPFARERYWLPVDDELAPVAVSLLASIVAPAAAPAPAPAATFDPLSYVSDWVECAQEGTDVSTYHRNVVILSNAACFGMDDALRAHYAQRDDVRVSTLAFDDATVSEDMACDALGERLRALLEGAGRIDALYFVAADERDSAPDDDIALKAGQERNEVLLLRMVKALKQYGLIGDSLDTWVLTTDNHPIDGRPARYWGAGASGLAYSLAQGNHRFRVRNLDLSSTDFEAGDDADAASSDAALVRAIVCEPASDRGETFKLQSGRRYRQTFFNVDWDRTAPSAIKHGGVYLIVGGNGIVGRILTRKLIAKYGVNVYWLGRSPADAERVRHALRDTVQGTPAAANCLHYLQADALSEAALRDAVAAIKRRHGRIDGAIFSGMVFGTENSIDSTTEDEFRAILEVKTLGSRAFYAALRDESLDFLCYFSSGQAYSFSGAAKLSAYAAGIAFGDSFVRAVAGRARFPVGTINWGFWQAAMRERIEKIDGVSTRSIVALEDDEGFACFERFVSELQRGRLHQVLCMRAAPEVKALMQCSRSEILMLAERAAPVRLDLAGIAVDSERIAARIATHARHGLDELFARMLFRQLHRMVAIADVRMPQTATDLQRACGISAKYLPWLRQSLDILAAAGLIDVADGEVRTWGDAEVIVQGEEAWADWNARKPVSLRDPDIRALTALIDACMEQLPQILRGNTAATDVIFPNGAMDKVAGLYGKNAIADTFNQIVASTVAAYVGECLRTAPESRLRILEVGAGTGGTSAEVFRALAPYRHSIAEYAYTDLSKAFFQHAERDYLLDNPYIVCRRLDIESPIATQGFLPGSYDLVLSTNALHSTRNIRRTLRHAKSALRRDGLLAISEMCAAGISTHLTFALLDGWWLFEDAELRIPGCPGLSPATWQHVLQEEGFSSVLMPGTEARPLGSQVIVAYSDGIFRTALVADSVAHVLPQAAASRVAMGAAAPLRVQPAADIAMHVQEGMLECLSVTLKLEVHVIDADMAFSDYGIDSILGVGFIDRVNARFGINLNVAIVFEYSSVTRLSKHVAETYIDHMALEHTDFGNTEVAVAETDPPHPQAATLAQTRALMASPRTLAVMDTPTFVRTTLLECLSVTLKIAVDAIDTDIAFSDYGIDSILGVNFIDCINVCFGIALNTSIIFEHSSVERLGRHLNASHADQIKAAAHAAATEHARAPGVRAAESVSMPAKVEAGTFDGGKGRYEFRAGANAEIAIVGMSGKFPKADNIAQFWRNLVDGVDGVDELPSHYLDQAVAFSPVKHTGMTRCKWGGILADRDCFDPLFFNISPKEAESMNPHQRLVMQESWNALEDAGYDPKRLAGSQTAIFVGAEPAGYIGDTFTGLSDAIVASRFSYALDFTGPAFVVNTGCSSSAVAIHLGCESLRNGESDLVLAGGVNACVHQNMLVRLDQIDMLSPSGRCFTFDKAGDGTIISEGVAMIVLKRMDEAIANGDRIHATVCGSGINQDGASNGITAPNGAAQEQLIVSVYERFGIDARSISYVEAHGTGTRLGDPIETNALVRAFRRYGDGIGWCAIGSAKSHIGHAAAAAGVIGVIKVLLSMRHRTHPKLLNYRDKNPLIQFDDSPFRILDSERSWESLDGEPRMAAVNSFGHSGTNVHLVLKEYRSAPRASRSSLPQAVALPLSAKTPEQLHQRCEDLLGHLRAADAPCDLEAIAHTLQVGREPMEERLGIAAASVDDLIAALTAFVDNIAPHERSRAGVFRGQAKRNAPIHTPASGDTATVLLEQWCEGLGVAWDALWLGRVPPQRVGLPGYPFAKERYWMHSAFGATGESGGERGKLDAASFTQSISHASMADNVSADIVIGNILDRIAGESITAEEGVRLLKAMV